MSNDQQPETREHTDETVVDVPAASVQDQQGQVANSNQPTSSASNYSIFRRPMKLDPLSIAFTILVFIGGIMGYVLKNSTISLVSGTISALLLVGGTYLEGYRKNPYPLMTIFFLLGCMMLYRYLVAQVFFPSGLVALLSFIMLARHGYLLYLRRQASQVA